MLGCRGKATATPQNATEPRRAYHRSRGMGPDYLRTCGCDYCKQDREAFRAAIQPLLTQQESTLLGICERLEPRITTALEEALGVSRR